MVAASVIVTLPEYVLVVSANVETRDEAVPDKVPSVLSTCWFACVAIILTLPALSEAAEAAISTVISAIESSAAVTSKV